MTNLVLVISGALIAIIGQSKFAFYSLPAAGTLILLGIYGWFFARKHYERHQLYTEMIREICDEIDRELGVLPWPDTDQQPSRKRSLGKIRGDAEDRHYAEFPRPLKEAQKTAKTWIARLRVHYFWEGFHLVVIALGLVLVVVIVLVQHW